VKERNYQKGDKIERVSLIGDVKDQNCIIIDDIVDSGGTLINAAKSLKEKGAKKIIAYVTHGLMNENFADKVLNSE